MAGTADSFNYIGTHSPLLRAVDPGTGLISTMAGNNQTGFGGDGGPARNALIGQATALAADASNVYFLDWDNYRIRRIGANGIISTVAGNGSIGDSGDGGPATSASLGMDVTADGGIDFASSGDVAHLDAAGIYHRLGGIDGRCGYAGDGGPFTESQLCQPWDSARDANGNLYVANTNNNRIRRVDAQTGVVTTFAGNGGPVNGIEGYGHGTYCGDGGPAIDACLNTPYGIDIDAGGSMYVSEQWQRIRRIAPNSEGSPAHEWCGGGTFRRRRHGTPTCWAISRQCPRGHAHEASCGPQQTGSPGNL